MKKYGFWTLAALLFVAQVCLLHRCNASESVCDSLPRIIGAFGAENNTGSPVSLGADIRSQLPQLLRVRRVLNTSLAPTGEQIVIYDSNADDDDPHPKVAFVVGGRVVKLFNGSDLSPRGGFERYLSSCEFNLTSNERALSIAISTGYDGAASSFAIIRWQSGDYRVVFNPIVGQGRMEFGVLKLELWNSVYGTGKNAQNPDSLKFECTWCQHHYVITEYMWQNDRYIEAGSRRTKRAFDPAEISGTPLVVKVRFGIPNHPATR
jgi:hypothetical protein